MREEAPCRLSQTQLSRSAPVRLTIRDSARTVLENQYSSIFEKTERFFLKTVPTLQEAEDLAQVTLIRAWEHIDSFRGEATLETWVHRIAMSVLVNSLRTKSHALIKETVSIEGLEGRIGSLPCQGRSIEDSVVESELVDQIWVWLSMLPKLQKDAVILAKIYRFSTAEVAGKLKVLPTEAHSAINAGMQNLKRKAKNYEARIEAIR